MQCLSQPQEYPHRTLPFTSIIPSYQKQTLPQFASSCKNMTSNVTRTSPERNNCNVYRESAYHRGRETNWDQVLCQHISFQVMHQARIHQGRWQVRGSYRQTTSGLLRILGGRIQGCIQESLSWYRKEIENDKKIVNMNTTDNHPAG